MEVTIRGERIPEQLREVKEDLVTILSAESVSFNGSRVRAMIDLFRRVAGLDRQIKLAIRGCWGSMGMIVQEALAMDSVSEIIFARMTEVEWPIPCSPWWPLNSTPMFPALCLGMQYCQLVSVCFEECTLSREQAYYLGGGLISTGNSRLKRLQFLTVNFQDDEAIFALVYGLRQNSTLQSVAFMLCSLKDVQVFQIAEALLFNPSLRELALSGTECGVQGMKALATLLSKNRKLEALTLTSSKRKSSIRPLAKSLEGHPSLEYLELSYNRLSDSDLLDANLAAVLSTCPRLETLNLSWNMLTHHGWELLLASQPLPRALRRLYLGGNNFYEKRGRSRLLLRLLQENPQLCHVEDDYWGVGTRRKELPEIEYVMDLNESGIILLGKDHRSVPLSLWPLVLERANGLFESCHVSQREQRARRANAIFHLLQGPALMQRSGD
jgi:hypothetical protein